VANCRTTTTSSRLHNTKKRGDIGRGTQTSPSLFRVMERLR
jgi:hypothetical protein